MHVERKKTFSNSILPTHCHTIVTGKQLALTTSSQVSLALLNMPFSVSWLTANLFHATGTWREMGGMPQTNILSGLRSYLCSVPGDASDVVNRTGWEMLLAILAHPEVGGKSEDDQAKARHEGLLHKSAGNDG